MEDYWSGSLSCKLEGVGADRAWSLLGDFCGLKNFHSKLATSHRIEGADGEPGCVRYCSRNSEGAAGGSVAWAKERLVEIDRSGRSYSYEIAENNMGIGKYNATLKVVEAGGDGCEVVWSFAAEPIEGWTRSGFVGYVEEVMADMGRRVREALLDAPI